MNFNVVIHPGETVTIDLAEPLPYGVIDSTRPASGPNAGDAAPNRGSTPSPR
jgi:hypothetical protein